MADKGKQCAVCNIEVATTTCAVCGKDLCEKCQKEFIMDFAHPALSIKGHEKIALGRAGKEKKIYCPDCLDNLDVPDFDV